MKKRNLLSTLLVICLVLALALPLITSCSSSASVTPSTTASSTSVKPTTAAASAQSSSTTAAAKTTTSAATTTTAAATAAEKTWNLKYQYYITETHVTAPALKAHIARIEEQTGGRVKFTVYWNNAIVPTAEALDAIKSGLIDMGIVYTPNHTGQFPATDVGGLPFLFSSNKAYAATLNKLIADGLITEYDNKGFHLNYFQPTPIQSLCLKSKAVTSMEDLSGLKLAVSSGPPTEAFKLLGAVPVTVSPPDYYLSIDRGVIDGYVIGPTYVTTVKLYEVTKSFLDLGIVMAAHFEGVNQDVWDSFPDDIKAIIAESSAQASQEMMEIYNTEIDKAKDVMKQNGVQFTTLSADELERWKTTVKPGEETFIQSLNANGLDGQKIVDTAKAVEQEMNASK